NEGDFFLDRSLDYISTAIRLERSLNEVRLDKWALMERCSSQELGVVAKEQTISALRLELEAKSRELDVKSQELDVKSQELDVKSQELNARSTELQAIK